MSKHTRCKTLQDSSGLGKHLSDPSMPKRRRSDAQEVRRICAWLCYATRAREATSKEPPALAYGDETAMEVYSKIMDVFSEKYLIVKHASLKCLPTVILGSNCGSGRTRFLLHRHVPNHTYKMRSPVRREIMRIEPAQRQCVLCSKQKGFPSTSLAKQQETF